METEYTMRDADSTNQVLEGEVFTKEEIDLMFTKLRENEVEAIEMNFLSEDGDTQTTFKERSRPRQCHQAQSDEDEHADEIPTILDPMNTEEVDVNGFGATELSHQFLTFNEFSDLASESVYSMFQPERYRLIYVPWICKMEPGAVLPLQKLTRIAKFLIFKSDLDFAGNKIYTTWIKMQNVTENYLSYNVKKFNSRIFAIRESIGLLKPKENKEILIETLPGFKFMDFVNERIKVYIAPCEILDIYAGAVGNKKKSKGLKGKSGNKTRNKEKISVPSSNSIIQQFHIEDYWNSYGSPWFPRAEINEINDIRPVKSKWLKSRSWKNSLGRSILTFDRWFSKFRARVENEVKKTLFPDRYANGWQFFTMTNNIPTSSLPENEMFIDPQIHDSLIRRKFIKFAVCSLVLFFIVFAPESPFLKFRPGIMENQEEQAETVQANLVEDDGWVNYFQLWFHKLTSLLMV